MITQRLVSMELTKHDHVDHGAKEHYDNPRRSLSRKGVRKRQRVH